MARKDMFKQAPIPTKKEIEEACRRIKASWTDEERQRRDGHTYNRHYAHKPGALNVTEPKTKQVIRKPTNTDTNY